MIPDWLLPTFLLFPALLWMFVGVGLPWALALLPRSDWRQPITVIAVSVALGPVIVTAIMFGIGTFASFSAVGVLLGSGIAAAIGTFFAWRNRTADSNTSSDKTQRGNRLIAGVLILVIGLSVILRFWNTAYWPYTTYDEFWVYGYNAKLFMLHGNIPTTMGYYPQLLPLAYTYMQLMWGSINDHAARTVVPMFALGSILIAYVLGAKLFNRRVGLLTAAIWALYPQQAAWSQFGDLEVPITLYFTGAAAFFILGWREHNRRYILLSGLFVGAALWTKPTAAALVESLVLIGDVIAVPALYRWIKQKIAISAEIKNRLITIATTLIIAAPLGGMWYIRNVLFGHEAVVLPAGYWQSQAQRSGQELGWLLLIFGGTFALQVARKTRIAAAFGGLILFTLGMLPSAFGGRFPTSDEWQQMITGGIPVNIHPTPLLIFQIALIAAGTGLLIWAAIPLWRRLDKAVRGVLLLILAFIVPYFVTWFWSYSYHYRLSFAIVPLFAVLIALLLDKLLGDSLIKPVYAVAAGILIVGLALPGIYAILYSVEPAMTNAYNNDHDKIARGNAALMGLVDFLSQQRAKLNRPLVVEAPGELRLAFFFPQDDIRAGDYPIHNGSYPTFLDQIANVDFFIDSSVGQRLYAENHKLDHNQILASLTRDNVMHRVYTTDDHNFRFSAYTVDNKTRFLPVEPNAPLNVQVGDFTTLVGYEISNLQNRPGQAILLTMWWQSIKSTPTDYSVFIHLWDPVQQKLVGNWGGQPVTSAFSVWQGVAGAHFSVAYPTRVWEPGEIIKDEWKLGIPMNTPPGHYELRVGLFNAVTGERLSISKDGVTLGDDLKFTDFTITPP